MANQIRTPSQILNDLSPEDMVLLQKFLNIEKKYLHQDKDVSGRSAQSKRVLAEHQKLLESEVE